MIVFQWYPATTPIGTDILQGDAALPLVRDYNVERAQEFKVLYDRCFTLAKPQASNTVPWQGTNCQTGMIYAKFKVPKPILTYETGTGSKAGTGKIYILTLSSTDTSTDYNKNISRWKVNYKG